MKVLIDARKLGHGGIGTYITNLIEGLLERGECRLGIIVHPDVVLPARWTDELTVHESGAGQYSARGLFGLLKRDEFSNYDLFHAPHYILPFGCPIPSVVTIHDLIHVTHPERFYYPMIARPLIRSALERARRVISVSSATAESLKRSFRGVRNLAQKIRIIPNAVERRIAAQDRAQRATGGTGEYFLSICSLDKPHKGSGDLIKAFRILRSKPEGASRDLSLVVAGRGADAVQARFGNGHSDISFRAGVSPEDLAQLYAGARALVVPSREEGFCLPVIEAQHFHVPVITTPIPAVEELLTSQDIVAEGFSADDIARGMGTLLSRGAVQNDDEVEREYERHLLRFDYLETAGEILAVYEEILAEEDP